MSSYKAGTQVIPNWSVINSGDLEPAAKRKLREYDGRIFKVVGFTNEDERIIHYIECDGERFSTPLYFEELTEFKGEWDT